MWLLWGVDLHPNFLTSALQRVLLALTQRNPGSVYMSLSQTRVRGNSFEWPVPSPHPGHPTPRSPRPLPSALHTPSVLEVLCEH